MELQHIIRTLREEREKLDELLTRLEALEAAAIKKSSKIRKRRGRTSMGTAERREVSERMRRYWAARREGRQ